MMVKYTHCVACGKEKTNDLSYHWCFSCFKKQSEKGCKGSTKGYYDKVVIKNYPFKEDDDKILFTNTNSDLYMKNPTAYANNWRG